MRWRLARFVREQGPGGYLGRTAWVRPLEMGPEDEMTNPGGCQHAHSAEGMWETHILIRCTDGEMAVGAVPHDSVQLLDRFAEDDDVERIDEVEWLAQASAVVADA